MWEQSESVGETKTNLKEEFLCREDRDAATARRIVEKVEESLHEQEVWNLASYDIVLEILNEASDVFLAYELKKKSGYFIAICVILCLELLLLSLELLQQLLLLCCQC